MPLVFHSGHASVSLGIRSYELAQVALNVMQVKTTRSTRLQLASRATHRAPAGLRRRPHFLLGLGARCRTDSETPKLRPS